MRGSKVLSINDRQPLEPLAKRKGRNPLFVEKRNEALVYRYYFYCSTTNLKYDSIIENLSEEFYLSTVTIPEILTEILHLVKAVKQEKPSIGKLKKKFPYYNWNLIHAVGELKN